MVGDSRPWKRGWRDGEGNITGESDEASVHRSYVIRRLAIALSTSADTLVFPNNNRGPTEDLNLHLEAINQLDKDEQQTIRHLIEGALLRHQAKKLAG